MMPREMAEDTLYSAEFLLSPECALFTLSPRISAEPIRQDVTEFGSGRMPVLRNVPLVSIYYIGVLILTIGSTQAAQYGTAEEAKAMLGRAIAAVKQDEANALDHFNKGDDGFKDRDLYVFCANASDGIVTAHPTRKGAQLKNFPLGQQVMRTAAAGKVSEVTYQWPRPGSAKPLEKHTFYTKVGDQICGVGYYK